MKYLRFFLGLFLCLLILSFPRHKQHTHPTVAEPQFEQAPLEDRDYVFYTVQSEDTLTTVLRKFRVPSEDAILKLNPDLDPDRLPVNQQIKIPLQ